jgi:hypothetical protein
MSLLGSSPHYFELVCAILQVPKHFISRSDAYNNPAIHSFIWYSSTSMYVHFLPKTACTRLAKNSMDQYLEHQVCLIFNCVVLRAWSHVVHQTQVHKGGAKSSNIILEGSNYIVKCPTCSLYTSFMNWWSHDQNYYLTIHKAFHRNSWS